MMANKESWQMTNEEYIDGKFNTMSEAVKKKWREPEKVSGIKASVQSQWDEEHEGLIKQAIKEGKPVPKEVLSDYDLAEKLPAEGRGRQ